MSIHKHDVRVVGFVGRAGTGKDTAAEWLIQKYGFVRAAFADPIKTMVEAMLDDRGIDYAYLYEPGWKNEPIPGIGISARELQQRLGDAYRSADPQFWVHALADKLGMRGPVKTWAPVHDRIVISDVRYPNEAAWVKGSSGTLVRLIRGTAQAVREHSSEWSVDLISADHTLINSGDHFAGLHGLLDGTMACMGVEPRQPVEVD